MLLKLQQWRIFHRLEEKHSGRHDLNVQENKLGQKFVVDAQLFCDLQKAGLSDELTDTVDYGDVYKCVANACLPSFMVCLQLRAMLSCGISSLKGRRCRGHAGRSGL
jgi:hypothetical protein